jgi:hypothetical protein
MAFTDTYLILVDLNGMELTSNDDYCGDGSEITYTVPDGTACASYTLREGNQHVNTVK